MSSDTDHFSNDNDNLKEIKQEPFVYESHQTYESYDSNNKFQNNSPRPKEINGNKRYSLDSNHSANLKQTNDSNVNGHMNNNLIHDQFNEDENNQHEDGQNEDLDKSIDKSEETIKFQNKKIDINKDDNENDKIESENISSKIINNINITNNHNKNISSPSSQNKSVNSLISTAELNNNDTKSSNQCVAKEQLKNLFISIFYIRKPYVRESMVLNKNLIYSLIMILFSIIFYVYFFNSLSIKTIPKIDAAARENTQSTHSMKIKELESKIDQLKLKYPNQTGTFWANIESTFRHSVLDSKDPSIIMIVDEEQTRKLSEILVDDIFKLYLNILGKSDDTLHHLTIDPKIDRDLSKSIESNDSNGAKLILDNRLIDIFNSGNKLAMIKNIQHIPAKSMILFYTYGDILPDAKYPGVLILMRLNLNENLNDQQRTKYLKSTASLSLFVETHLRSLWSKSIHEDQLAPLFSRIGNNIILVNNE